jgi:aminopeptidase N
MPASAEVDGHEWTIRPNAPLLPGSTTTVEIDYGGNPDQTPFRAFPGAPPTGWQPDDQGGWYTMSEPYGASNWVPVSDHPSDKATWKVTLDTPSGVTGVSNGHLVSHESRAGRTRWVWQEDEPMASYLVLAAVGAYDLDRRTGPDGMDLTFAFPPSLSKARRSAFDELDPIVTYFGDVFGPLPGRDLGAIVVDDDLGVALEVQSRPLFAMHDISEEQAGPLAHELAHQWFGNDVTLEDWRDLWLNEGFATYADWLYQASRGADIDAVAARTADDFSGVGLTVRDADAAKTFDMVVYNRGALTLHALRKTVGDDDFFRIMRTWVRRHSGRSATTEDFVTLASEVAGRDLTAFFASWLDSPDQPDLPD